MQPPEKVKFLGPKPLFPITLVPPLATVATHTGCPMGVPTGVATDSMEFSHGVFPMGFRQCDFSHVIFLMLV